MAKTLAEIGVSASFPCGNPPIITIETQKGSAQTSTEVRLIKVRKWVKPTRDHNAYAVGVVLTPEGLESTILFCIAKGWSSDLVKLSKGLLIKAESDPFGRGFNATSPNDQSTEYHEKFSKNFGNHFLTGQDLFTSDSQNNVQPGIGKTIARVAIRSFNKGFLTIKRFFNSSFHWRKNID